MTELWATVQNEAGIHCRPSAEIVKAAKLHDGDITIEAESGSCDPRSALALISLGLVKGARVRISVSGPGEEALCRALADLFERHFDFPPRKETEKAEIPTDIR